MLSSAVVNWEIVIRLVFAVIMGGAVGIERSLAGKTAGMRTYALVSLGSALFVLVAELVGQQYLAAGMRNFDPLRVASQVIVGVGFLGTGLIMFRGEKVSGLTTAAGVWVAAGVGMAAGYGLYLVALFVAILTLLIFTLFWTLEQRVAGDHEKPDNGGQ